VDSSPPHAVLITMIKRLNRLRFMTSSPCPKASGF
jgi:hypothetical protein